MGILLAIIAGAGSIWNLMNANNTAMQIAMTILALLSMLLYSGRRSRKSYNYDGTRQFTIGFAICLISFIGSGAILLAFLLHLQ